METSLERSIAQAAAALHQSGVVACPTEAVYGLSCSPLDRAAFDRLLMLKQRPLDHGVLLIGADFEQLRGFIDLESIDPARLEGILASWPGPRTWIFPRAASVPDWLAGKHPGIALRLTAHPVAAALCRAFGGALVSTSANRHGQAPARCVAEVVAQFDDRLDTIIDGPLGGQERPTPIHDALTGAIIRS